MMKNWKNLVVLLAMIALIGGLASCHAGPLERAGKKVDKTIEKVTK